MSLPIHIGDGGGTKRKAQLHKNNGDTGLKVFADPLYDRQGRFLVAVNPTYGLSMAQNFSFSGTPDQVHNGTDSVLWTGTEISGNKTTFDSTEQASAGTKSVKTANASINNVYQFDKGSDLTVTSYTAVTFKIYIDSNWTALDEVQCYCWDTTGGATIGVAVDLTNYMSFATFGEWQSVVIPFADFEHSAATFDAIRFEQTAKSGQAPTYYLDTIQVEQTSGSETYTMQPDGNTKAYVDQIYFSITDALDTTLVNNSMPNLSYNKILNVSQLTNGISVRTIQSGEFGFTARITNLGDMLTGGGELTNSICDGTNTFINVRIDFEGPIILDSRTKDKIEFVLSDDLSGLISMVVFGKQRRQVIE